MRELVTIARQAARPIVRAGQLYLLLTVALALGLWLGDRIAP